MKFVKQTQKYNFYNNNQALINIDSLQTKRNIQYKAVISTTKFYTCKKHKEKMRRKRFIDCI